MDWGREDYPGTQSRKRMFVKRQQGKIKLLKKEREEGKEKIAICSGMKGSFEENQGKSRRQVTKKVKSKYKGRERTMGDLLKEN